MNLIDRETEIIIHGFDPIAEPLKPDKSLIDFATFIEDLEIEKNNRTNKVIAIVLVVSILLNIFNLIALMKLK